MARIEVKPAPLPNGEMGWKVTVDGAFVFATNGLNDVKSFGVAVVNIVDRITTRKVIR
jgi:hypothetical protein